MRAAEAGRGAGKLFRIPRGILLPGASIPNRVDLPVVIDSDRADNDDALLVEASMSAESQSQP
jgi:hypothetical protein